jgi:hypothetical protein
MRSPRCFTLPSIRSSSPPNMKAGGCHDDIGLQLTAGFQRDATFRKGLDVIRDD